MGDPRLGPALIDAETPAVGDFIRRNLPLTAVPFVPEIGIHKAVPASGLHRLARADEDFGSPYWAHYWAGGLALARFILDRPERVAGRRVLDIGTGSGIVAIAASLAGAREVVAMDVDPYAVAAASLNAEANKVAVTVQLGDPTVAAVPPACDLVMVADLFYERETAERVIRFLRRCAGAGSDVLIGDPARAFLPREGLRQLERYEVSESIGAAADGGTPGIIFTLAD